MRAYIPTVLIAAGLLAAGAGIKPLWPWHPSFAQPWDHHHYLAMAQGHSYLIHPYATRLLVPALAGILGHVGSIPVAFFMLAWTALTATGAMLYEMAGWRGVSMWALCLYALIMPLWDFYLPDAMLIALITLALYCTAKRVRWGWYVPITVAAMLTKSVGLIVPLIFLLYSPHRLKGAALLILGAGIYVGLKRIVPVMNGDEVWIMENIPHHLHSGAVWRQYGIAECFRQYGRFDLVGILRGCIPALLLFPLAVWRYQWRTAIVLGALVCATLLVDAPERVMAFAVPLLAVAPLRRWHA